MKFLAENETLTITLEGWEIVNGLKRKIVINRGQIADLTWQTEFRFVGSLFRVGGVGLPRVLYAGHFRANGNRAFLYLRQPKGMSWTPHGIITAPNVLAITTVNHRYSLILLNCDEQTGKGIANWWKA